ASIDWGDGTTTVGTVTGGSGVFSITGSHTYPTIGSFNAGVTGPEATAPSGTQPDTATATPPTTGSNPLAVFGGTIGVRPGQALSDARIATFTDSNAAAQAGDFSASINWGDGTTTAGTIVNLGGGNNFSNFAVTGTHTFTTASSFSPVTTVTITNAEAGTV